MLTAEFTDTHRFKKKDNSFYTAILCTKVILMSFHLFVSDGSVLERCDNVLEAFYII